ncbi:ECF transporter S component [Pseudodesulfovibrio sp. zrk46]|uniref:ECF transporter S component n=1 Tax=Pseudodesulfovibrio sp. zrk46 TaxID=2725288 RepID=UPI001449B77E|nr:ECF transporter S component [Pseudodesulfovibrio sp. zrk46]QJB57785.1 ECF transporter S component [Pseudodesulfovibrio sp. zrk46]
MSFSDETKSSHSHMVNLPIVGGLILFTVFLGTTDLGFIPVPTQVKYATSMHLPTILASLLEGWPAGMIVGTVFGLTSMFTSGTPMASDPFVALLPRMFVGLTPYVVYLCLRDYNDYVRLGVAAVTGTLTNTMGFLGMATFLGYMQPEVALSIAVVHGLPECIVAVIIVIPGMFVMRRAQDYLQGFIR